MRARVHGRRRGSSFWLKKIVSGLVLLPAGPMLARDRRARDARGVDAFGRFLMGLGAVTLFVFSLPVVANALAARDERLYPPLEPSLPLPADAAIVVLGGGSQQGATDYGGETINATTLARLRSAAHLAARTRLPILVTGGRLPIREAHRGRRRWPTSCDRDFPRRSAGSKAASLDTDDNARLSVPMLKAAGIRTAVLVTDVSHMRRARAAFEADGMTVDLGADRLLRERSVRPCCPSFRTRTRCGARTATLHEWLGAWWMQLRR